MCRLSLIIALVAALATPLRAQARAAGSGDSVVILVHRVRPDQRAQYDSLMTKVWAPAIRRAAVRYPEYGRVVAARRRYVPTDLGGDSTYTYVYVYPRSFDLPKEPGGGNAVLRAAGMTRAQSDSFAAALRRLTASLGGGRMQQSEY
jgi:hypothetical protein